MSVLRRSNPTRAVPMPERHFARRPRTDPAPWPSLLPRTICVATLMLVGLAVVLDLRTWRDEDAAVRWGRYAYLSEAVPICLVGALIAARRPGNRIGTLMQVGGSSIACDQFTFEYIRLGSSQRLPAAGLVGWMGNWTWAVPPATLLLALLLFPDGRLPSRRWRPVAGAVVAWSAAVLGMAALGGGVYDGPPLYPAAALGGSGGEFLRSAMPAAFRTFPLMLAAVAAAPALRFHRARGDERRQLMWLAWAGVLVSVVWMAPAAFELGSWERAAANVALWIVPIAIGVAILRHRLYAIDKLVSRTIVYAVLTGCVGAVYLLSVTLLGTALEQRSGLAVSLVASAMVAIIVAPLRARLQRAVDRLLYGLGKEPLAVMSELSGRLEAAMATQDVIPAIVDTVGRALKIPYGPSSSTGPGRRSSCARAEHRRRRSTSSFSSIRVTS